MKGGRWPRILRRLVLTLAAILLVFGAAIVVAYMLRPIAFQTFPGQLAFVTFMYPLHILSLTPVLAGLCITSWRSEARLASGAFGLVFLLAAFIALWPSISMWQFARQEKVTLSL